MFREPVAEFVLQLDEIGFQDVSTGLTQANAARGPQDVFILIVADVGRHHHIRAVDEDDGAPRCRNLGHRIIGEDVRLHLHAGSRRRLLQIEWRLIDLEVGCRKRNRLRAWRECQGEQARHAHDRGACGKADRSRRKASPPSLSLAYWVQ